MSVLLTPAAWTLDRDVSHLAGKFRNAFPNMRELDLARSMAAKVLAFHHERVDIVEFGFQEDNAGLWWAVDLVARDGGDDMFGTAYYERRPERVDPDHKSISVSVPADGEHLFVVVQMVSNNARAQPAWAVFQLTPASQLSTMSHRGRNVLVRRGGLKQCFWLRSHPRYAALELSGYAGCEVWLDARRVENREVGEEGWQHDGVFPTQVVQHGLTLPRMATRTETLTWLFGLGEVVHTDKPAADQPLGRNIG